MPRALENPIRAPYDGPGLIEWVTSFACAGLVAADIFIARGTDIINSAESIYNRLPFPQLTHVLGLGIDFAFLLVCLFWIFFPAVKGRARIALMVLSIIGIFLFWVEAIFALQKGHGPVYVLRELPFRPLTNFGLIGSQVFVTYLTFLFPSGKMPQSMSLLVKLALAISFFFAQNLVWDGISQAISHTP